MTQTEFLNYLDTFCEHYEIGTEEALSYAIIKEVEKEVLIEDI